MRESKKQPGAVLVGSRTMQEGGAFLDMTREDVELFCIDHLLMVDIIATEEALMFDVRLRVDTFIAHIFDKIPFSQLVSDSYHARTHP